MHTHTDKLMYTHTGRLVYTQTNKLMHTHTNTNRCILKPMHATIQLDKVMLKLVPGTLTICRDGRVKHSVECSVFTDLSLTYLLNGYNAMLSDIYNAMLSDISLRFLIFQCHPSEIHS